jgi:hypothetical protein
LLPGFLRQLRPLMVDLGTLADQGTPLFNSLAQSGPDVARQYENLIPFAAEARKSLIALGASSAAQQPLLLQTFPFANRVLRLGTASLPTNKLLDQLTASLDQTGGIEDLMRVAFFGPSATNGFDQGGHFIRTEALVGACTGFTQLVIGGCSANFTHTAPTAADVASVVKDALKPNPAQPSAAQPTVQPRNSREAAIVRSAHASGGAAPAPAQLTGLLHYLIGRSR